MNRKDALEIAKDFRRCSELCTDYEVKKGDIEFFEYIIKELEGTAPEVPVQEQSLDNFSTLTGEKLHETCPKCWVKGNKPFNCGFKTCPGYRLFTLQE